LAAAGRHWRRRTTTISVNILVKIDNARIARAAIRRWYSIRNQAIPVLGGGIGWPIYAKEPTV